MSEKGIHISKFTNFKQLFCIKGRIYDFFTQFEYQYAEVM